MNRFIILLISASVMMITNSIAPGNAQSNTATGVTKSTAPAKVKKSTIGTVGVTGIKPTAATYLTTAECTKLGGTVSTTRVCNGRKLCETTDQNGDHHYVCINEK